jgi:hypothetical protein
MQMLILSLHYHLKHQEKHRQYKIPRNPTLRYMNIKSSDHFNLDIQNVGLKRYKQQLFNTIVHFGYMRKRSANGCRELF